MKKYIRKIVLFALLVQCFSAFSNSEELDISRLLGVYKNYSQNNDEIELSHIVLYDEKWRVSCYVRVESFSAPPLSLALADPTYLHSLKDTPICGEAQTLFVVKIIAKLAFPEAGVMAHWETGQAIGLMSWPPTREIVFLRFVMQHKAYSEIEQQRLRKNKL